MDTSLNKTTTIEKDEIGSVFVSSSVTNLSVATTRPESNLKIVLSAPAREQAVQMANSISISAMDGNQVVMYGNNIQKAMSAKLDAILAEITKSDSPVLFELFRQLKKGIETTNIGELESEIRKSVEVGWFRGLLEKIGLASVADRLQSANEKINTLITSKSTTLQSVVAEMEKSVQTEAMGLINATKRLSLLGSEYRNNIETVGIHVEAGRMIYDRGLEEYTRKQEIAIASGDPLKIEECKKFKQILDLFLARVIVLETVYAKAPVEMEYVRLGEGASLTTLAETANTVVEEFNDIKSALIKLSVAHRAQSVQIMNAQRRELRRALQGHSTQLLDEVAVNAEKTKGTNRLEDAEQLLDIAKRIDTIAKKVDEEAKINKQRFADARAKLAEAKAVVSQIQ